MYAFDHMRQAGVFLTTFESIVLQLTQDAGHPKFKQIQQISGEQNLEKLVDKFIEGLIFHFFLPIEIRFLHVVLL